MREYERRDEPVISGATAAAEAPESNAEVETEAERRAEAARRAEVEAEAERRAEAARRAEMEEAARIARQAQEQLREARAAADAARAKAEAEASRRREAERRLEEHRLAALAAARSIALADMESGIESALTMPSAAAEPLVLDATSAALEGLAEARVQPHAEAASPTIETLSGSTLGDEDEPTARGTVFAHAPAFETAEAAEAVENPRHLRRADDPGDPADDAPKMPKLDDFDIAYEVARLLENRRWEKRDEPFQGFESPPGRF